MSFRQKCNILAVIICTLTLAVCLPANGQILSQAVGGISIDADGLLKNAKPDDVGALSKIRKAALQKIPGPLNATVGLRKVSLRRLEAALDECLRNNTSLPDAIKYLAGLQRIRYVFVYPEQKDIVLAGPGDGWKVDAHGNVVGVSSGRPVMLLEDLLVALRTAHEAAQGGITCSIDPTAEGLARVSRIAPSPAQNEQEAKAFGDREAEALGMQQITIHGVPTTSHFARVLTAADYRMKRIAMNLDPSPVRGLPSYLQMLKPNARTIQTPRFWLEPKYEALLRDGEGTAFELRGSAVKALTEEDYVAAGGNIQHSHKSSPAAQNWANKMTESYAQLAVADPVFGQLQNCMDLAVVGALVARERLAEKAGHKFATLFEPPQATTAEALNAPKQVFSLASYLKKGKRWIVSASGGVAINSWLIAQETTPSDALSPARAKAASTETANWWWN
jgi:hypothetical protein